MDQFVKKIVGCLITVLLLCGCKRHFDNAAFVSDFCTRTALPAYSVLNERVALLHREAQQLGQQYNESQLIATQIAWQQAMDALQYCKSFDVIESENFAQLEQKMVSFEKKIFDRQKGNAALLPPPSTDPPADFTQSIVEKAAALHTAWKNKEKQLATDKEAQQTVVRQLVAQLQALSGQMCSRNPGTVYATDYAHHCIRHNLEGIRQVFGQGSFKGDVYNYVLFQQQDEIAEDILLQFDKTEFALENLQNTPLNDRPGYRRKDKRLFETSCQRLDSLLRAGFKEKE